MRKTQKIRFDVTKTKLRPFEIMF